MRNSFLIKSYTKCGGETSPRPFFKKSKMKLISGSTVWNLCRFFSLYAQFEDYQNSLKLRSWPLAFTSYKVLFKNKKRSWLLSLPHFLHDFRRKIFLILLLYSLTKFHCLVVFTLQLLWNMCIGNLCFPADDVN